MKPFPLKEMSFTGFQDPMLNEANSIMPAGGPPSYNTRLKSVSRQNSVIVPAPVDAETPKNAVLNYKSGIQRTT